MIQHLVNMCYHFAGSRHHEKGDAESFASWEVDFLKYDNCWAPASDWVIDRYTAMHDALNATGRPIYYSMCDWGVGDPWLWAPKVRQSRQYFLSRGLISELPRADSFCDLSFTIGFRAILSGKHNVRSLSAPDCGGGTDLQSWLLPIEHKAL